MHGVVLIAKIEGEGKCHARCDIIHTKRDEKHVEFDKILEKRTYILV
jgi:hypothetical protein